MKTLFDTSVVVAAFIAEHEFHAPAEKWLRRARANEFAWCVSSHCLAEIYSTLTRLPLPQRVSTKIAHLLIHDNLIDSAEVISLTETDYFGVVERLALLGISGAIIYDALHVAAAEKAGAGRIVTFNARHFEMLAPKKLKIVVPV